MTWQGPSDRRVLFLDFDGVLHRGGALRTRRRGIVSEVPGTALFEFAHMLERALKEFPTVELVLSTTWVQALGYTRARDFLPLSSLRSRVVGATYHSRADDARYWLDIPRGRQVLKYVERHRLEKWVALDDRADGFEEHAEHLVLCEEYEGLGAEGMCEMLERKLSEYCS